MMDEYFKINSLWKRQGFYVEGQLKKDPTKHKGHLPFIEGDYACEEFYLVKKWHVEEKIDGTNIRISYGQSGPGEPFDVDFLGRTSNSQMPCELLKTLKDLFPLEKIQLAFPMATRLVLYGEGYGPKIQSCGGNYRADLGFILFDVYINGWWLEREGVKQTAEKLSIPCAPFIGTMSEKEIVHFVKSKPMSLCSKTPQVMEGIIARTDPTILFRNGNPLLWKLKCKEF